MKIILATTSPYRIEAMKLTGIPFEAKASNVEEKFDGRPNNPEELVKHLSKLKAEAVAKDSPNSLVIGMDTIIFFEGKILEKPKSYEEAFERLKEYSSGKKQELHTGITLINTKTKEIRQEVVKSSVNFREITEEEIKRYLGEDSRYNTYAFGYDPLGHSSSTFIQNLEGDPNNILRGIPTAKIVEMIKEAEK